jgi:hypothetical protein
MGTGDSFPEVKRPGREADHSPPISAEVKKMDLYIHSPFMAQSLIKHRDNFTFLTTPSPERHACPDHRRTALGAYVHSRLTHAREFER